MAWSAGADAGPDGGEGDCWLGPILGLFVDGDAVGETLAVAESLWDGEGEGVGDGLGDAVGAYVIEGVGVVDGEAEAGPGAGSAWH